MPEAPTPILGLPVEFCRIMSAEQMRCDGATIVRWTMDAPEPGAYSLVVPDGEAVVLRFAPTTAAGEDAPEHIEYVGAGEEALDDSCFAQPGRQGGLRILNPARAYNEHFYLGAEPQRLARIQRSIAGVMG